MIFIPAESTCNGIGYLGGITPLKFKKIWSSEERGELKIWISESSATSLWIKHGKLAVDL